MIMIFPVGKSKSSPRDVIDILRSTLKKLEQSQELASDDAALAELRNTIMRSIAELEIARARKAEAA